MPDAIGTVGGRGRSCAVMDANRAARSVRRALRIAFVPLLAGTPRWEERMLVDGLPDDAECAEAEVSR